MSNQAESTRTLTRGWTGWVTNRTERLESTRAPVEEANVWLSGLQVGEEVGFRPSGAALGQHILLVAEHISDGRRGVSRADGGDALEGFLPGPEPPVFRLKGGGEDVEAVGRTMRFHEGQRPGLGGGEQRTVGSFQLHGGTGVEIDRHGLGTRVRGSCRSLPDGFGEGEDDARQGEKAHQQDEPMADAVPGPAFLPHLAEEKAVWENWTLRCLRKLKR